VITCSKLPEIKLGGASEAEDLVVSERLRDPLGPLTIYQS